MAGFLDKVVESLNRGVNSVSESSKYIVEKANINTQIKDSDKERTRLLQNIGMIVYNMHKQGELELEACDGMFSEITAIEARIDQLRIRLQELEEGKNQPQYYEPPTAPTEDGDVICECGSINKADAKFCAMCGKPLE